MVLIIEGYIILFIMCYIEKCVIESKMNLVIWVNNE